MKLKHLKLIKLAIAIGAFCVLIAIFSLLKLNESVSEYFYARGISRGVVFLMGNVSDLFGFSIFGILVIITIILIITCLIICMVLLKKRRRTDALALFERLVLGVLCIAFIYVITASGCYNRQSLPIAKYENEQLSTEESKKLINGFLIDFNKVTLLNEYSNEGKSICPYSFNELNNLLKKEYKRLDNDYFSEYTPTIKKAVFSKFMSYQGICGITFQPLGEAVINFETPNCYLILTMAHELAHTKGVMRERDANMLSYYLLLTSEIPYFRYCGYMYSLGFLTSTLYELDATVYSEVMTNYPSQAQKDRKLESDFWQSKIGIIDKISTFFNDLYLKLSGVSDGTANYSDPSKITDSTEIIDGETIIIKHIQYSDTARMLIQIGKNRNYL